MSIESIAGLCDGRFVEVVVVLVMDEVVDTQLQPPTRASLDVYEITITNTSLLFSHCYFAAL